MSDWNEDDQASSEANTGIPELPDWAKQQVSQANREAAGLRQRLKERETEILSTRFQDVLDLLPDEVTSYDAKVTYLQKLQERIGVKTETPVTPENSSEEPSPEVAVPDAEKLAGIVNGPSGSASGGSGMVSRTDWLKLVATDPAEAQRLHQAGKVELSDLREGLGPDR